MKVRVLGCGTSFGVPRIGNDWGLCDPHEPRNRRLRSSILLQVDGQRLLVDCGPDVRQQLLEAEVGSLDAVIVTHDHADHCHGIDELRAVSQANGGPIRLLARAGVLTGLERRFGYIFKNRGLYEAVAEPDPVGSELLFGGARIRFVDQPHGGITSLGMRVDHAGKSIAYSIDFNALTEEMRALYQGVDVWISDCLGRKPHPTHAHLEAVLRWGEEMKVGKLYLSHLNNSMDYQTLVRELPDWAAPAHDGLEIAF
ncbi:MBL fold metallo-hydrolase [Sphingomonas daechungensis]|uniref:MBL fold metallo-hydrolase n=1 Tax=Sphingomonas daechungensis TaxID=1176646 RepID=UPI003783BB74